MRLRIAAFLILLIDLDIVSVAAVCRQILLNIREALIFSFLFYFVECKCGVKEEKERGELG